MSAHYKYLNNLILLQDEFEVIIANGHLRNDQTRFNELTKAIKECSSVRKTAFVGNSQTDTQGVSVNDVNPTTFPLFRASFPWKLHEILDDADRHGQENIVSWLPSGTAFRVHNPCLFVTTTMPLYFKSQTKTPKYKSFLRQLHIYGFQRIKQGSEKGAYTHAFLLRGHPELCTSMVRTKIKTKDRMKNTCYEGNRYQEWQKEPAIVDKDPGVLFNMDKQSGCIIENRNEYVLLTSSLKNTASIGERTMSRSSLDHPHSNGICDIVYELWDHELLVPMEGVTSAPMANPEDFCPEIYFGTSLPESSRPSQKYNDDMPQLSDNLGLETSDDGNPLSLDAADEIIRILAGRDEK